MRYAGWYPRRRGILEHLDSGKISLLDAAVHDHLCLTADYKTGVSWSSAEKIRALCPRDVTLRAVQRSLARLEEIGWIKRFRTRGQHGNYPIVVGKFHVYSVTDDVSESSSKWLSVNLERTIDWRAVELDNVTDQSLNRVLSCHPPVTDRDVELSPSKEVKTETQKPKRTAVRRTTLGGRRSLNVENRDERLRRGLIKRIQESDESLKTFLDDYQRDCGERYPDWWSEVLEAANFVGFQIDENDPTVTLSFTGALTGQFRKHEDTIRGGGMLPGIFATKVIDELMRNKQFFPPSFTEHRDGLRSQESQAS